MSTSDPFALVERPGIDPTELQDAELVAQIARDLFAGRSLSPSPGPVSDAEGFSQYPSGAHASTPPVHPGVAHVHSAPSTPDPTSSGGHQLSREHSHAFGEPRCETSRTSGTSGRDRTVSPVSAPRNPGYLPETPGDVGNSYYFLSKGSSTIPTIPASPIGTLDVEAIRKDFPALHQRIHGKPLIWLDNAATTHKPRSVIDATSEFYSRDNSNIHRAAHTLAARATELYEAGREKVRQFLGASDTKEIVFVRGTTEAINLVAQSYGRKNIGPGDEILLTTMEHHANIVPWQLLSEQTGATIRVAPINDAGELILDQFVALLSPRTKLVGITHVANALGTINPVEQIISIAHAYGVPVLVDGAQSSPHMPINVKAMDADFFAISGHKIFGPTGIGVLYGKAALLEEMPPWQGGGNMIQDVTFSKTVYQGIPQKFEAGTQDIAGVVGLGAAVDYLMKVGMPAIAAYEHGLLDYATKALASVPGIRPIGTAAHKASVLSFVIDGVPSEQIGRQLDEYGIAVRSGHHCAQPALRRFGVQSTVRPSLAFYNTPGEVDALVRALHQILRNR